VYPPKDDEVTTTLSSGLLYVVAVSVVTPGEYLAKPV
jgi:hypothetical protein